eukprot:GHVU01084234.1.p2 GENE.GHVU01084234.1~~GHVU01084234.1.p2  ORF type:complete len:111 (-),score=6.92 GHVU01084234.1:803-1135(-)
MSERMNIYIYIYICDYEQRVVQSDPRDLHHSSLSSTSSTPIPIRPDTTVLRMDNERSLSRLLPARGSSRPVAELVSPVRENPLIHIYNIGEIVQITRNSLNYIYISRSLP